MGNEGHVKQAVSITYCNYLFIYTLFRFGTENVHLALFFVASKQEYHAVFFLERAKNFSFDRIMVLFLYDYKDIPVRSFLKALSFKKAQ